MESQAVVAQGAGAPQQIVVEVAPTNIKAHLEKIRQFQEALLEHLQEGHDYAVIPGTKTKSLLQPGAEKVMRVFSARPRYTLVEKVEDMEGNPFFFYRYKCELIHVPTGAVIGEGEGSCNSREDKYAYRWVFAKDLPKHLLGSDGKPLPSVPIKWRPKKNGGSYPVYRVDNDEVCSLANTIAQMAMKRSNVKASRTLGCLSGLFTQDLEDLKNVIDVGEDEPPDEKKEPESKKAEAPEKKETTPKKQEQTPSTTGDEEGGFIPVTKADTDTVTKFLIENDEAITSSKEAFAFVAGIFAERDIKVTSLGTVLANPGHRKALMNALEEKYNATPEL